VSKTKPRRKAFREQAAVDGALAQRFVELVLGDETLSTSSRPSIGWVHPE